MPQSRIKSVAVVGAGASGAATVAALAAENAFDHIRVFERRESSGGTWIYDNDPGASPVPTPGALPPKLDPRVEIPSSLPATTTPVTNEQWDRTPAYASLTTNVPAIAMSFSDCPFAYGTFVPHWVAKQNIVDYFACNRTDYLVSFNTKVEDITKLPRERWRLVLRQHDPILKMDRWWQEDFDALVLANGHFAVPFIPFVPGLVHYIERYPGKIMHSKFYRNPTPFVGKKVLIVGNSASGTDIATELRKSTHRPLYISRRRPGRWDGPTPPPGILWKPVITQFNSDTGAITFSDETYLEADEVDQVIYCTGYQASFPFWNEKINGGPLWDYKNSRLIGNYLHTFFRGHPTLGLVGIQRSLTFRTFEYQAIALARIFAGRNNAALPDDKTMRKWESERAQRCHQQGRPFHLLPFDGVGGGEMMDWLTELYNIAGLPTIHGDGKCPPVFDNRTLWELQHVTKDPTPEKSKPSHGEDLDSEWVTVDKETDAPQADGDDRVPVGLPSNTL